MTSPSALPDLPLPPFTIMGDRLLILRDEEPEEKLSRGGIIIPKTAHPGNLFKGRVVQIGPGMLMFNGDRWPMPDCNVGDHIVYNKNGTTTVKIEDREYVSMHQENVLAVIEDESGHVE